MSDYDAVDHEERARAMDIAADALWDTDTFLWLVRRFVSERKLSRDLADYLQAQSDVEFADAEEESE